MKVCFLGICFFALSALAHGQDTEDWRLYRPTGRTPVEKDSLRQLVTFQPQRPGVITVIQDPRIADLDEKKKEHPTLQEGFRVQIFFGKRDEAQRKRAEFLRLYPEERAHISYLAPNFRLRVGDFRKRLECEAFKKQIEDRFVGCYIVQDKIEMPRLDTTPN